MIHFGEWNDDIHDHWEQQDRIDRAALSKTSPDYVDIFTETAVFAGSGKKPYTTSLNSCTCGDFINRHLPCKHIYRLAMELGLIKCDFARGRNKNTIIKRIQYLSPEAKQILLKVMQNDGYYVTCAKCTDELIINGFCCENIDPRITTKNVILEALPEIADSSFDIKKELRRELEEEKMCQMTFEEITEAEDEKNSVVENITGEFACCSHYRECSDKKECLFKNDELHAGCMYKKNLEKGLIFYGKNAAIFSPNRYEQVFGYYKSLSDEAKEIFHDLIAYFSLTKRASTSCLCLYNEKIHDLVASLPCFSILPEELMTAFLFDVDILQIRNAEKFNKQHSDITPPDLNYISQNKELNSAAKTDLKKNAWKKFYLEKDYKSRHELSNRFLFFGINRMYSIELNELFNAELSILTTRHNYKFLKYFENNKDDLALFRKTLN